MNPDPALQALSERLGHEFRDAALLATALTHRSAAFEARTARRDHGVEHNERLEFLGDAVLSFSMSDILWRRFPRRSEGELTRLRAAVVNEANLAAVASSIGLGDALRLGRGEAQTGGRAKPSLLADALEAVFAAVYLDAGIARAAEVVARLLGPSVDALAGDVPDPRDAKTLLQERSQAALGVTPRYAIVGTEGPDHVKVWSVEVVVGDALRAQGSGRSRKAAEQVAARAALGALDAMLSRGGDGEPRS